MKMAPFSVADQEHVNTAQVVELVLENQQDTIWYLSIAVESYLWKLYPRLSMYIWDTVECVHGGYQDTWWKFTKIDVWRCSFKGGANGFPKSMVTFETWVRHFAQNELYCSGHIHLYWEPQNVKYASMLEGCGICILCCRSHEHCIRTVRSKSECEHMLWHAVLTALGY